MYIKKAVTNYMLHLNMLLLTLLLGTLRPFGLLALTPSASPLAAGNDLEGFVTAILNNSDKIGIGVGFLVLAYLLVRSWNSQDQRAKNEATVDTKQLEIQNKQLTLVGQGIEVGAGVKEAVGKLDAAIDAVGSIGRDFKPLIESVGKLITTVQEDRVTFLEALKKSQADTYLGLEGIRQLVENLPNRLVAGGDANFLASTFNLKKGILISDGNGVIVSVNAAALEMFKLKKSDILNKPFYEIGQITTDPITLKILLKDERPTARVLLNKSPIKDFLFGYFNEDSELFDWFLMDIYPNVADDKVIGIMYKFISIGELMNVNQLKATTTQTIPQLNEGQL